MNPSTSDFDEMVDDTNFLGSKGEGQPENRSQKLEIPYFDPSRPIIGNSPPAPDFISGVKATPSMNQGFNPANLSYSGRKLPAIDQPCILPRFTDPLQSDPPTNEWGDFPKPATSIRDAPEDGRDRFGSSSNSSPLIQPTQLHWDTSAIKPPDKAIFPPRADGEHPPTLTEVNPESGSITGGVRVWLTGLDFPAIFPLFARFGTAVVPTVRPSLCISRSTSPCLLDVLRFQPSCLPIAPRKHARGGQRYTIEAPLPFRTRVRNQYCEVSVCGRPSSIVSFRGHPPGSAFPLTRII